ncbi:heparan-alpha-glucosaminide N-acetyltransferase-like isoform X2 [Mercenaria mercenaria]|nr:heparan-alpha-glucosaminide N-acetyltransferase-like isoform X2 [Mercenaria mercenaria]XP_045168759.2 heparan-alpha-glucosaminide N-acetyltransferase-like isoform X2 [Mercenaria mercenaria]XP_045168760.2 heparan-alpha-glucosaminide N-acetyltransferase-like isoform X2 [Mercenaria mercenaria]XP_053374664.1 heparan-alpha-glucosaminide N-acetyltransferase-like isoform X2 [Mercenaria mercenaria]
MTFNSSVTFDIHIYTHNHECWKCELIYLDTIPGTSTKTIVLNTTYGTDIELRRDIVGQNLQSKLCGFTEKFRENGDYWLFYNQSNYDSASCDFSLANDPMIAEMPILYVGIGVVVLWIIVKAISYCYKIRVRDESIYELDHTHDERRDRKNPPATNDIAMTVTTESSTKEEPINTHKKSQRLHSLDTFRGLSLVIMIFVNYGGGGYWFFDHPPWNGLTIADLVFPWFVFIMGTSMNYSFKSMLKRGKSRGMMFWKVLKRTCLLFAFGIVLNTNWGPVDLNHLRIPGVLQRLSLSYFGVAFVRLLFAKHKDIGKNKSWFWIRDVVVILPDWIISLGILATHLALTFVLHVPGCPTGYIGPGGLHEGKLHEYCTGGAAGYIDRLVLGENHLYSNPTPKAIYQTKVSYDPEGILGTLTSIFLCFLGLQAGRIFVCYEGHAGRLIRLLFWSLVTGAIGAALCNFSKNDGIIPLNKNLWSVSFIMVTACFGFFLLGLLYVFVDVLKVWNGAPFIFAGMNPLVLFLCHDIFYRCFPINWQIDPVHWKLLIKAVWDVIIYLTLAFVLYCKKVFIAL